MSGESSNGHTLAAESPSRSPTSSARRWLLRLVLVGASGAVALIAAEIGLRLLVDVMDVPLHIWDPVVGPRKAPDQTGRYVKGRHVNARYSFNAQGWNHPHDYTTIKSAGSRRVCIVGDSFVEALQVPYEETFFAVAERTMSRPDRPVEWYAFGCSGYGATHEYMLIHHYVLDYNPDVVVMLFVQNDPIDCSPYLAGQENHSPLLELDGAGSLVLTPARQYRPSTTRRLLVHSALVRFLTLQCGLLGPGRTASDASPLFLREAIATRSNIRLDSRDPAVAQRLDKTWQLIEAILRQAQTECASRGAVFALAFRGALKEIEAAERGESYDPPARELDPYCLNERLDEMGREYLEPMARRLGIPYLDLTAPIIAEVQRTGQIHDFPDDAHYGPVGHQAGGKAMAAWIERIWEGES